ncbi:protein-disulfide reductase DsbD domain-containing protein [Ferruginibacter sp.]
MKKIFFALVIMVTAVTVNAQILNPVKLSYSAKKTTGNQYELHIKATIDPKWHLYSTQNPDGGAEPTAVNFTAVEKVGKIKEKGTMKTVFEKAFGVNQKYFETTVEFIQIVKVKPGTKKVAGSIEYEVCNDKQCLPPKEVAFEISL